MPRLIALAPLLALLAGCTQFPEIDARVPEAERLGPPPPLVDVLPLLARAEALARSERSDPAQIEALVARAAALEARATPGGASADPAFEARLQALSARAEALRAAPVIDPATRDRLARGVDRPAALQ